MKKFVWMVALFAALAMVFTGCGGGGGGGEKVTITFDLNGGPGTAPAPASIDKDAAIGSKLPASLEGGRKDGNIYTFTGWFTAATAGTPVTAATTFDESKTVYAQWSTVEIPAGAEDKVLVIVNYNWPVGSAPAAKQIWVEQNTAIGAELANPNSAQTPANYEFAGWYGNTAGTGTAYTASSTVGTTDLNLYAKWTAVIGDPYPTKTWVEKVELVNGNVAAYYFELPSGKTFADYDGIKADFLVDEDTYEAENRVRGGPRLYGNYPLNYLKLVEVTTANAATPKFFAASIGNGDGEWGNGNLILDNGFLGGGWGSISDQLATAMGNASLDAPVPDEWWTLPYWTDATKKNDDYNKYNGEGTATAGLYNPTGAGPFIFGLGLTGQADPTVALVADVRLVGKNGTADLIGKPLYIKATADDTVYPAFVSYSSTSGNGVESNKRTFVKGTAAPLDQPAPIVPPSYTVTFDLNSTETGVAFADDFTGTKEVQAGYAIGALPSATIPTIGWIFGGWAETATGTTAIGTTKKFYADKTVYAIWTFDLPEDDPIPLNLTNTSITNGGGIWDVAAVTGGYKITYGESGNNNYGWVNPWFQLNFATLGITDLTDIKAISFVFTPISGDLANKEVVVRANASASGWIADPPANVISATPLTIPATPTANEGIPAKLLLNQTAVEDLVTNVFVEIYVHAGATGALGGADSATSFSITDVKLIPFAAP